MRMICMYKKLLEQIDHAIAASRQELARDTIKLIGVKSVKGDPQPGAPFGPGPRAVLDTVLEMGEQEGFHTTDYKVGVVSLALKEGQPDLGIWLHGDVVPEGTGWDYDPYQATEYKGCIIGRGATDNKGQLCAIYHLLKIFKELNIPLNYNPALYVGSDEEFDMRDLKGIPGNEDAKGFCNVCTPPKLSLVPDGSFPVGYGGKGSMNVTLCSKRPLHNLQIVAGQTDAPGKAVATVFGKSIITHSPPRHSSKPDPNGNMITRLMERLLEEELAAVEDRPILEFFKMVSLDIHGDQFGINVKTDAMRPLTVFAQKIDMINGCPALTVNIRYPVGITYDEIIKRMGAVAAQYGLEISSSHSYAESYLLDKNWPVISRLNAIANDITGADKQPYALGGYTYAHLLPNALVYGMDGSLPPEDFPAGRGSAHGIDECVSLDRLQRAMKIYARALLALNDMEW